MLHDVGDPRGFHPLRDFVPGNRIVFQHAGYLKKWDAAAVEYVGDLRHRTRLAVSQPFAGHFRPITQAVEPVIVDGGRGRQIKNNDRNLGAANHRQHGRGQGVGGDMEKYEVNIRLAELMPRSLGFFGSVDEAEIHNLDAWAVRAFWRPDRHNPSSALPALETGPSRPPIQCRRVQFSVRRWVWPCPFFADLGSRSLRRSVGLTLLATNLLLESRSEISLALNG